MTIKEFIRLVRDAYEIRIGTLITDVHKFITSYLREEYGVINSIPCTWLGIKQAIADYDELYMKDHYLIISEYVNKKYYEDLTVYVVGLADNKIVIYVGY